MKKKFTEFEVITTTDKDQRDRMFAELRASTDPLERQVVKFSSNQVTGKSHFVQYTALGKGGKVNHGVKQFRPEFRSIWSVAYPKAEEAA
jgi:hypothetical protein